MYKNFWHLSNLSEIQRITLTLLVYIYLLLLVYIGILPTLKSNIGAAVSSLGLRGAKNPFTWSFLITNPTHIQGFQAIW